MLKFAQKYLACRLNDEENEESLAYRRVYDWCLLFVSDKLQTPDVIA